MDVSEWSKGIVNKRTKLSFDLGSQTPPRLFRVLLSIINCRAFRHSYDDMSYFQLNMFCKLLQVDWKCKSLYSIVLKYYFRTKKYLWSAASIVKFNYIYFVKSFNNQFWPKMNIEMRDGYTIYCLWSEVMTLILITYI